jgi:glutamate/tyrosine decarboxylase-like PLP-dependent enzyme
MNSDAAYAEGSAKAQKNLTLEFSRRARGIPVWAALRTLGRAGVAELIDSHVGMASRLAAELHRDGFDVLNRVILNQLVVRSGDDAETNAVRVNAQTSGDVWFGATVWDGRPAFRISVSSWRTSDADIDHLIRVLRQARMLHRSCTA